MWKAYLQLILSETQRQGMISTDADEVHLVKQALN